MRARSPKLGHAFAATAATLWALSGSLARFLLDDRLVLARPIQHQALSPIRSPAGWSW